MNLPVLMSLLKALKRKKKFETFEENPKVIFTARPILQMLDTAYFHFMNEGYSFLGKCFCKRPKQSTSWKKPISKCMIWCPILTWECTVMTLEQVHLYCSISRSFEVYILLYSTKWSVMWCMIYFLLFKIVAGEHPLPVKILVHRLYIIPTNTRTLLWCIHLNYTLNILWNTKTTRKRFNINWGLTFGIFRLLLHPESINNCEIL